MVDDRANHVQTGWTIQFNGSDNESAQAFSDVSSPDLDFPTKRKT